MASIKSYKVGSKKEWSLRAFIGYHEDGGEYRVNRKGYKSKKEAEYDLKQLTKEYEEKISLANVSPKGNDMTYLELYNEWLVQYRKTVKPSTVGTSVRTNRQYIMPIFAKKKLKDITVKTCQEAVNEWSVKYKNFDYHRKEMQRILKYAVDMNYIIVNPMEKIIKPKRTDEIEPVRFYQTDELKYFINFTKEYASTKIYTFLRIIAMTGMRRGECLALKWQDIDLDHNKISISRTVGLDEHNQVVLQSPKTINSNRTISIDSETAEVLAQYKLWQNMKLKELGLHNNGQSQLLFTDKVNSPHTPTIANDWLRWVYEKNRKVFDRNREHEILMKMIHLHGFRHTHCSLLFESGASIKEVQARLGHGDIRTTMNIYAHVTPKMIDNTGE